jgi:hypothetical protein
MSKLSEAMFAFVAALTVASLPVHESQMLGGEESSIGASMDEESARPVRPGITRQEGARRLAQACRIRRQADR